MSNRARDIFVENFHTWMLNKKMTHSRLASILGLPLSTISSWYNGQSYPRVDSMQRLADALGISMRDLTDEREDEKETNFSSAEDAVKFILEQPMVAQFGGYDLDKMTDEEIIEFANDVAGMIELLGKKYKK